jgi:hypothetical protein
MEPALGELDVVSMADYILTIHGIHRHVDLVNNLAILRRSGRT